MFTPVNGIISTLFVLILVAGYPADALFAGVVISNSVIGIVQELQARRTLNELAVLSAPKARVRRDGETNEIGVSEVVADELLELFVVAIRQGLGQGVDTGVLVDALRPAAGEGARIVFGQQLERAIGELLADTKRLRR